MSIKLWLAAVVLAALAVAGVTLLVGPLTQLRLPAMICMEDECARLAPAEVEPTANPSPTDVIGLSCPEGQHWAQGIKGGAYCAPD